MSGRVLVGVDQGTTGTRAVAFDERLRPLADAYRRVAVAHPRSGWIEKDAGEVVRSVAETLAEVVAAVGGPDRIAAVGLDNEGETVAAWDAETLAPLAPAVVWGCRRSAGIVERLAAAGAGPAVEHATGLPLDPYFSATKIRWLCEEDDAVAAAVAAGRARFGTLDAYVTARLAGGARSEPSTAARTQLQALDRPGRWDEPLLRTFGVDAAWLPAIGPSSGELGELRVPGLSRPLSLRAMLVDQTAALAGHGCLAPGSVKATYGTGIFVLEHAGTRPLRRPGVLPTVAWQLGGAPAEYALDGGVFSAGTAVDWLVSLGLLVEPAESEALARSVPDSDGVRFLPALAGLGAPWWRPDARGVFAGLSAGTTRGHLARAVLDALCFRVRDILDVMAPDARPAALRVDGGLTANGYLVQRQADVLGVPVVVADTAEATALGAAAFAGVAAAVLARDELPELLAGGRRCDPDPAGSAAADADYRAWRTFAEPAASL